MFRLASLLALVLASCTALYPPVTRVTEKPGPTVCFRKERLDRIDGVTGVCLGPEGDLYACTFAGQVWRYRIDPLTGRSRERVCLLELRDRRILGLAFDPEATPDCPRLWITHDGHPREGHPEKMTYTGVLSRWEKGIETPVIVGFPAAAHALSGPVFGPDGLVYLTQGAATMAGGATAGRAETPLTATVLVADVRNPAFNGGRLPLDVRTTAPTCYDPAAPGAPLKIYAHGVRQAYDLCWHSNGQCYAGVNMNDRPESTPARPGVPALYFPRPDEQLIRIEQGVYYGHPNPCQGKYVLLGGNPGAEVDPWEVPEYPVGVQPEPDFRPDLLIYNLARVGGDSADGCVEYRRCGPWQGRMLVCFYAKRRAIGSFAFSPDGTAVTDFQILRDESGNEMKFASPLDIATDATGRLYVADFTDNGRFDGGKGGGLWLLVPEVR